ncbi:MAG: hypothetical protein NC489_30995 [Ruminococcus flavefaciens]|nr:hypothetical protein [Ruminococcus flavefaciens]
MSQVKVYSDSSMKHINKTSSGFTQVPINTAILFTDEQLEHMYQKFHSLKSGGFFDGSFTDFCTYCFCTCANTYLSTFADFISEVGTDV